MLSVYRHSARISLAHSVVCWLTALLEAALLIAIPLLIGQLVGAVPDLGPGPLPAHFVPILVALLIALVLRNLTALQSQFCSTQITSISERFTTLRIGQALSASPDLSVAEDREVRSQVEKIRGRSWEVQMAMNAANGPVLAQTLGLIGSTVALGLVFSWWVALLLILAAAADAMSLRRTFQAEMDLWGGKTEPQKHAAYAFGLGMGNAAKEIRVFGLGSHLRSRYQQSMTSVYQDYWKRRWGRIRPALAIGVGRTALIVAGIAYAAWCAEHGRIDLTDLATTVPLLMVVGQADMWPLGAVTRGLTVIKWLGELPDPPKGQTLRAMVSISERPSDQFASPSTSLPKDARPDPVRQAPEIVFDDVSFAYPGASDQVLHELNLTLPPGRPLALVGVNGAGKSTLVKVLCAAYLPTRGTLWVDGADVRSWDLEQRRTWQRRIAPVTQDFVRLPLPAGDNVELGTGQPWLGRIDAVEPYPSTAHLDIVARRAGIDTLVADLPSGWATPLDKTLPGGSDLSGGEWQRIGLARALRAVDSGAGLLVLDEPAAALDVESESRLVDGYLDLSSGITSLIISHRFSVVRPVPSIAVLADGAIHELGSHEELMAIHGRYARMFTLQASRYVTADADASGSGPIEGDL